MFLKSTIQTTISIIKKWPKGSCDKIKLQSDLCKDIVLLPILKDNTILERIRDSLVTKRL